jgi:hypothetical protein
MNTVKSITKPDSKSDLTHESKNKSKSAAKITDKDLDEMITVFKSIVKICESLITDSVNSADPKNNYVSLTNIFNKINITISFNTFINTIFSYTACDEKLQDKNEVKNFEDAYYLALPYADGKHPFLVKDVNIIDIKINNIYNHLNTFIKLCYTYSNKHVDTDESTLKKLHKLPLQELNNYIAKNNALLKVEIPYLLKNTKNSKKKVTEDTDQKIIDIKHNVRKSNVTSIESISHNQIYKSNDTNDNESDNKKKKNTKTKISKKQQVDTDDESTSSKNIYTDDNESVSSEKKKTIKNRSAGKKIDKKQQMNETDDSEMDNAKVEISSSDETDNDSD